MIWFVLIAILILNSVFLYSVLVVSSKCSRIEEVGGNDNKKYTKKN